MFACVFVHINNIDLHACMTICTNNNIYIRKYMIFFEFLDTYVQIGIHGMHNYTFTQIYAYNAHVCACARVCFCVCLCLCACVCVFSCFCVCMFM